MCMLAHWKNFNLHSRDGKLKSSDIHVQLYVVNLWLQWAIVTQVYGSAGAGLPLPQNFRIYPRFGVSSRPRIDSGSTAK